MEIKAQLNKPFTDKQKMDFIVQYNHNLDYKIEESSSAILALGKTQEELQEEEKAQQKKELQKQIEELDKKRIRAVCEPSMKTETQSWLEYYNQQIAQLRQVMVEL